MSEVSWHEAQLITLLAQCVRLTDRHSIIQNLGHAFSPSQASGQRLGRINLVSHLVRINNIHCSPLLPPVYS
jgi:hypothetical protein